MSEKEIKVLEIINNNSRITGQRKIASLIGMSVGTVNSIIKQLVDKEFILTNKISNTNEYMVSEKGREFLENHLKNNLNRKIVVQSQKNNLITQAVILAAGENLHFKTPVGFLKLGKTTVIERTIDMLIECGIQEIIIIIGYECNYYEEFAKKHKNIKLFKNDKYRWNGTMASLSLAKDSIKSDFILIESDIVFESSALQELFKNKNRNCVLITNKSGSEDEVFVEIKDDFIFKMSKDLHQFNRIDGELVGISKISKEIYIKMLEEFNDNTNPYFNYEYALLDVARTFNIGYAKLENLIWSEIDTNWHYRNLVNYIYPMLIEKEHGEKEVENIVQD
ncbi:NTP transferase domain-containing protein [Bacillus sp. APMAM]|nr:NTP transferase domain-containing protein [Bacillus sp. APMAM]